MSDPTHDDTGADTEAEAPLIDPAEFGPEAIDGTRTGGEPAAPAPHRQDEPGDPEVRADPEDAPTS